MSSWIIGATKMLLVVQAAQSGVTGTIRDEASGEPLVGAIVVLPSLSRVTITDSSGFYTFLAVPPGRQPITVQRVGFVSRTLSALVPRDGQLQINIVLHRTPQHLPGIVVRSPVPIRGLERSDSISFPEREVSIAAIRASPLLSEPDGLLGLDGGEIASSPESPSGLHVRGAPSDQTAYLLDGIPVFSPYHAAGTFSAWNPDALQRLQLSSASPSPEFADALSGIVLAVTRVPGSIVRVQGGFSTAQARLAVDGPLGDGGAGYLLSYRTGFPGLIASQDDPTYLKGTTGDLLAKVETPTAGGQLRLLVYDGQNAIKGAAFSSSDATLRDNLYQWHSQSVGLQWGRPIGRSRIRLQTWTASSDADANWTLLDTSAVTIAANRRDVGALATVERNTLGGPSAVGARVQWSRALYRVGPTGGGTPSIDLAAQNPLVALFFRHQHRLGRSVTADVGGSGDVAAHDLYLNLQTRVDWQVSTPVRLWASYSRSHQFAQSLRNPESIVGTVFPADLYLNAGTGGVPVARSDRGVLAAEYRAAAGVRVGAQIYLSDYSGLLLVAPRTGEPFATNGFTTGSGLVPGFSVEAGLSRPRYGLVASYGWQRVQLQYAASTYTPAYGASHVMDFGAIVFPWTSASVRVGATGIFGRRATPVFGGFEWESCNLLDRGCEFAGSPHATGDLGGTRLPAYFRLDLSVRRQWELSLGGRDVTLAFFATMTNLLGRRNLLTVATDPASGRHNSIDMRPFAPLVAGLDWRF
jgi:carboxypeptidase family protein